MVHNNNSLPFNFAIIEKEGKERLSYLNDTLKDFSPNKMTLTEKRELLQSIKDFTDGSLAVIMY